jgi:hypothetical protein
VSLNLRPTFDALSYTWGDWWGFKIIKVNGKLAAITKNLYDVLIAFRRNHLPETYLWVDALCINQRDVAEREAQVSLMRDIFEGAARVRVWLGKEKRYSRLCFETIMEEKPIISKISVLEDESFLEGIYELLLRSWWRRLWVVQEITLAADATAHCGDLAVGFRQFLKNLVDHIFFLSDNRGIGHAIEGTIPAGGDDYSNRTTPQSNIITPAVPILAVFSKVRNLCDERSDPREVIRQLGRLTTMDVTLTHDRLYGILGLCPASLDIQPQYRTPIETVFEEGAMRLITWSQSLELLRHAGIPRRTDWLEGWTNPSIQVPSWVPLWNIDFESWNNTSGQHLERFAAAKGSPCLTQQPKRGQLVVRGLVIDAIKSILKDTFLVLYQEIAFGSLPLIEASRILQRWRQSYRELVPTLDEAEQSMRFWRSLVFDCIAHEDWALFGEVSWRRWRQDDLVVATALEDWLQNSAVMTDRLRRVLYRCMREGQMAFTASKRICIVPEYRAQDGDFIAILCGLGMPAILRSKGNNVYQFVGVCYCDGA